MPTNEECREVSNELRYTARHSLNGYSFQRAAKQSMPVVMIYKGLSVVFDSAHDAEKRTGIPAKSIQKCCTGRLKSTHGASFAYLGAKVVHE